jgi:hypothetical protein
MAKQVDLVPFSATYSRTATYSRSEINSTEDVTAWLLFLQCCAGWPSSLMWCHLGPPTAAQQASASSPAPQHNSSISILAVLSLSMPPDAYLFPSAMQDGQAA